MKLNDTVKWSSQAQGSWKTKTGVILQVVPAGGMPDRDDFRALYNGAGCGSPRNHESYVVGILNNRTGNYKLYWPRVSALKEVKP